MRDEMIRIKMPVAHNSIVVVAIAVVAAVAVAAAVITFVADVTDSTYILVHPSSFTQTKINSYTDSAEGEPF